MHRSNTISVTPIYFLVVLLWDDRPHKITALFLNNKYLFILILNFSHCISGLITGSNLQGIHQRYQAVLDIMVGKQCLLTEAMRQFGIPRNTLRDYITICKLHIIDRERYKREGWSRQNSKDWERSSRNLLSCAIGWFLMNTEFNQID